MTVYLYRALALDGDGDPLDHGVVIAASPTDAARELRPRLAGLEISGMRVRLYPLKGGTGVLESDGAHIDLQPCRFCGAAFAITDEAIQEIRDAYPDELMTDAEAANVVEACPVCAGMED